MTDTKSKTIVIVDDEADISAILRMAFEEEGYTVKVFANGKLALDEIVKEKPDLVISDILMPMMNGYKLCETIKSSDKTGRVPVILLTAVYKLDHHIEMGFKYGADAYFSKPFKVERLMEVAKKLMGDI